MKDEGERIQTVNQALHGYSEGHRLLASSLKLTREADRAMLMLSDLPGQVVADGFETYLTGYPLPNTEFFVLARTWYAAEMPRPGCVWTHSLLVPRSLLARTRRPSFLVDLFRRPSGPDDFKIYREPFAVDLSRPVKGVPASHGDPGSVPIRPVVEAFYGFPTRPVIVPLTRAADSEPVFLRLWDGQWESLRASFTFCTGSSSPRVTTGGPFSIQGVPLADVNRVARALEAAVVQPGESFSGAAHKNWLDWINNDLETPGEGPYLEFLRSLNGCVPGDRGVARPLAEVFGLVHRPIGQSEIRELIRVVAEAFPNRDTCSELKSRLFGPQLVGSDARVPAIAEAPLLLEFATTERFSSYDAAGLGLFERASDLARADTLASCRILSAIAAEGSQPLGIELLRGLAAGAPPALLREALIESLQGAALLVGERPELAANPESWSGSDRQQLDLVELLHKLPADTESLIPKIVWAALEGGAIHGATKLIASFGPPAALAALEWYDFADTGTIATALGRALGDPPDTLLSWVESRDAIRPGSFALLTNSVIPEDPRVRAILPAVRRHAPLSGSLGEVDYLAAMVWTFRLALSSSGHDSGELASIGFDPVYGATARGRLGGSWEGMEKHLPEVPWWKNWDRCERLRYAIRDRFVGGAWPSRAFLTITGDDELFAELTSTFRDTRAGRQFLRVIERELHDGASGTTPERWGILAG